jgi:hypothetical protein
MVPKTIRNTLKQLTLSVCSLILVGCSSAPKRLEPPNNGWLKVEAGAFSIYAPPGWEFHQKQDLCGFMKSPSSGRAIFNRGTAAVDPYC